MTDEEILLLANGTFTTSQRSTEFIDFARAIESRTLTNQKARWYEIGREAEREACAQICESMRPSEQEFDQRFYTACTLCADAIRARGE